MVHGPVHTYGQTLYINGRSITIDPVLWRTLDGHKLVVDGSRCNGCGPESSWLLAWLVPDRVCGVHVDAACAIHDEMCNIGGGPIEFERASRALGENVKRCLVFGRVPDRLARFMGARYRAAVHILGPAAFAWEAEDVRRHFWRGLIRRAADVVGMR